MEDTSQGQSAPVPSDAAATGTAGAAPETDVATSTETTTEATPPVGTDDAASSTATAEDTATETPEQKASRRERQREARKQAATPPPAPAKSPEEIIAEYTRQQEQIRAEQERQQRERTKYAKWVGDDPADPNQPNSPTRYQKLLEEASTPIPDGDDAFFTDETRALVRRVNTARQQLQELNERRGMLSEVYTPAQQAARIEARDWLGNEIERGIAGLGLNVSEIIASVKNPQAAIPEIVQTIGKQIAEAKDAEYQPKLAELEDDLAAERSENDALRRQLGGAAPQALRGGVATTAGSMTREQFLALPKDQKDKIRRESPALVADIYSRSA